jgi:formamidopyrimidine-DNA glycosylase
MPELPEVQTTVNHLARAIKGRTIASAQMDADKTINTGSNLAWPTMARLLGGKTITDVTRRAKFIVLRFKGGSSFWVHQKMTGHLLVGQWKKSVQGWVSTTPGPLSDDSRNRYIRLILNFTDGKQLALSDARRFARVILVRSDDEIGQIRELAKLGPEPFELSPRQFAQILQKRRGPIKTTLTDPTVIAGIGNIYADEILHRSGVHPLTSAARLDNGTLTAIYRNMGLILNAAIRAGGSSTDDYRSPDGELGNYQKKHQAYGRTGQPCLVCRQGTIVRIMRNGRSSHFCPQHQILKS